MNKTISFKKPQQRVEASNAADSWVGGSTPESVVKAKRPVVPMKRFTIDVPLDLHSRVKVGCAAKGKKMAEVLREMLEREFPET